MGKAFNLDQQSLKCKNIDSMFTIFEFFENEALIKITSCKFPRMIIEIENWNFLETNFILMVYSLVYFIFLIKKSI